jgi:ribosome-associated toxin RatA of RatAB toxin-antitoxin module
MARIEQSVEIQVPAHIAYNQLTQFEDYPLFMNEVESAQQVDDTHVRWTTKIGQQSRDWNSEIVEQQPDRFIAWRNVDGPVNTGRVDVEALSADSSRVTFTLESDAAQPASEGENAMARQVEDNLQRLKQLMESQDRQTGAWRGEVHDAQVTLRGRDAAAGSAERPTASTQSDNALSRDAGAGSSADGRFNVAEEVNLDQQSDAVRHTGNLPHQSSEGYGDMGASEALKTALQPNQEEPDAGEKVQLDKSIDRAVPPSN